MGDGVGIDSPALEREYYARRPYFDRLETEACFILQSLLAERNIKIHSMPSRVKSLSSFLEKQLRKQYADAFVETDDLVGLRVVCLLYSDIERVGEAVRGAFRVSKEDNKVEDASLSSFGYMSFHFTCRLLDSYAGPRYSGITDIPFEIQVRTIAMDAWASISHYLNYKTEADVPARLRKDFFALSGLFYVADQHFEMFFRESQQSRQDAVAIFNNVAGPPADLEINLDNISAFLRQRYPDRARSDAKGLSELVTELRTAGYRTISQIASDLDRSVEAFERYETDHPPTDAKIPKKYSDIGVVRSSLSIMNPDFLHARKQAPRHLETYRRYVPQDPGRRTADSTTAARRRRSTAPTRTNARG